MFDIGAPELLVIALVAIIFIGPKDMPLALRTAGRWIGKIRRVSNHFRSGIDTMIREAELEEMEKKWQAQNEKIMAEHPGEMTALNASGEDLPAAEPAASAEAATKPDADVPKPPAGDPPSKS
jgi:sec-independent protein translocase protein TatB